MIDVRGKHLKIGDMVAYPGANYSKRPSLTVGFLCAIDEEGDRFRVWSFSSKQKTGWVKRANAEGVKVAKIG